MPYINQDRRDLVFDKSTCTYNRHALESAGDLNYALTMLFLHDDFESMMYDEVIEWVLAACDRLIFNLNTESCYQSYNDVMGALVCCLKEFQRRFKAEHPCPGKVRDVLENAMDHLYKTEITPYEESKIKSNGDIL